MPIRMAQGRHPRDVLIGDPASKKVGNVDQKLRRRRLQ